MRTGGAAGYVDRAHIREIVLKKNAVTDNAAGDCLYSKGCTSLVSVKPAVHITLKIYQDDRRIARSFKTQTNAQYLELDCLTEEISTDIKDDSVYAVISCFWNEPDSNLLRGGYIKETLKLEGGKYVADAVCENPRKKVTAEADAILVSYGRGAAKDVDYWYPDGQRDEQGNQKVPLEVNGSVKLSGAVFKSYKSHDMTMFSISKGVIMYQGAALGGNAVVANVWKGEEKEIYRIKTDRDKEILATGDHQFQTEFI